MGLLKQELAQLRERASEAETKLVAATAAAAAAARRHRDQLAKVVHEATRDRDGAIALAVDQFASGGGLAKTKQKIKKCARQE